MLQDKKTKNIVYRTILSLPEIPGIASITLPETVTPLEIGKKYTWIFNLICNSANTDAIIGPVKGVVIRESLSSEIESQLEAAETPRARVIVYGLNGLWYDALTTLAELYRQERSDETLSADWADLLEDVGLSEIASEPLVECCIAEK